MSLFRRIFGSSRQSVVRGKTDPDPVDEKPDQEKAEPPAEPADKERTDEQ